MQIAGESLDGFFNLITCAQENQLKNDITAAILAGFKERNATSIMLGVEYTMTMAYCRTQKQYRVVVEAIKEKEYNAPWDAVQIDVIRSNLHNVSKQGEKRLDYFLNAWDKFMITLLVAFDNDEEAAIAFEANIQNRASANAEKWAHMIYADFQKLGDAVYDASIQIANIKTSENYD